MKRIVLTVLSAMLMLTLVFSLSGCKSSETPAASQAATEAAQEQPAKEAQEEAAIPAEDTVFTYNGTAVELNGDAEAILAALGEPESSSSQLSCHGEGEDKTYVYGGFTVNTYPLDGADRILEVVVFGGDIPTSRGVQVGDSVDKVTETYGDGYRSIGMYYAYEAGEGKSLQFFIENDVVQEIDYYYDV